MGEAPVKRAGRMSRALALPALLCGIACHPLHADDQLPSPADSGTALQNVTVTGTRDPRRKARDSASPIDVLSGERLVQTGATDLRDALERVLPSLTHFSGGGDLGAMTDSVQLRGLSPDQVLVLVNGKRRHTTANLYADPGPQQGSAPVDLDLIPLGAVDRIEILRDGAAAQYGSDAIAGVVNIILKSSAHGAAASATTGNYYQGDGYTVGASADGGLGLGGNGFLHWSAEYRHRNFIDRNAVDPRTGNNDNELLGDARNGRAAAALNAAYTLGGAAQLYAFGTYAHRNAQSFETYRTSATAPAFYPNGFSPLETLDENDFSITAGIRGRLGAWRWDLGSTFGGDYDSFGVIHSVNIDLLADTGGSPTSFHVAGFGLAQWTDNLDLSRQLDLGLPAPLNLAFGAEHRRESYEVGTGDPASYYKGGSQSYQGLSPPNAGNHARNNYAAYVDLSQDLTPQWQASLAGRFEHYTDFGNTLCGKFSTRYDFGPRLALRATLSNGFRAPSLPQEYYSGLNVGIGFANGQLAANSPGARDLGSPGLRPEKSVGASSGLVAEPLPDLRLAIDLYQIDIRHRIVDGGDYTGQAAINALAADGVVLPPDTNPIEDSVLYYTNGADTHTRGLDLTATYVTGLGRWGSITWDAAANFNHTRVTAIGLDGNGNPLLNAQGAAYLSTAAPRNKIIAGGLWRWHAWDLALHARRYGGSTDLIDYLTGPNAYSTTQFYANVAPPKYLVDLEAGWQLTPHLHGALGATDLFDVRPNTLPLSEQGYGGQYDGFSSVGWDGGYYYLRLNYTF